MTAEFLLDEILQTVPGKKPQLHVSGMNRLLMCGEDYRFRNVENVRVSPTFRLLEGTAAHRAAEMALRRKALGEIVDLEELVVFSRDVLTQEVTTQGARLIGDEIAAGLEARTNLAMDFVTDMAQLIHRDVLPMVDPIDENHVEWRWVIELPDQPYDLAGTIDVVENDGTVTDFKTKTGSPPGNAADVSEQLTWYAMARLVHAGAIPLRLRLLYLVRTPKTGKIYVKELPTTRCAEDIDVAARRIQIAMRSITSGIFLPAQADSWKCSAAYCEFHSQCSFAYRTARAAKED